MGQQRCSVPCESSDHLLKRGGENRLFTPLREQRIAAGQEVVRRHELRDRGIVSRESGTCR